MKQPIRRSDNNQGVRHQAEVARPGHQDAAVTFIEPEMPQLGFAMANPLAASAGSVLALQRIVGNQRVTRLVQAKSMPAPAAQAGVQRQAEEEEEVQTKPLVQLPHISQQGNGNPDSLQCLRGEPPPLPDVDELQTIGFRRMSGNHYQRNEGHFRNRLDIHTSVYHEHYKWDEFHVKFDDPTSLDRIYFFCSDQGAWVTSKNTPERRITQIVRRVFPGLAGGELSAAVDAIYRVAGEVKGELLDDLDRARHRGRGGR